VTRDFLIVGQGLAGSLLAWTLLQHKKSVLLVDDGYTHSASRVAAGIVNPLGSRRLVAPSDVEECWSSAVATYAELGRQFQQQFFVPKPLVRFFNDVADIDRYQQRMRQTAYQQLLGTRFGADQSGHSVEDHHGGFLQVQAGHLDIAALLTALQSYFRQQNILQSKNFDYADIQLEQGMVWWQQQAFKRIIFCEGARAIHNPWFRWLPFQLSKGETITVKPGLIAPNVMFHRGHWILPINEQHMKIGATYEWQWSNDQPSQEATQQLLAFTRQLLGDVCLEVVDKNAGIRPTTRDKQAFIGTHPEIATLHIFNGFGSRGSLVIPYYSKLFTQSLLEPSESCLPEYIDIYRFEGGDSQVTLSKRLISQHLQNGDIAIDATLGNGLDTEFLARCVGCEGHVYSFDIQSQALQISRDRLTKLQIYDRVSLIQENHANMLSHVPDAYYGRVKAITFNLGYMPGCSKHTTTLASTTLTALNQALQLLMPSGIISVVCYQGHPEGIEELEALQTWVSTLDEQHYHANWYKRSGKTIAPVLLAITRYVQYN